MFSPRTGSRQTTVRAGFADFDSYGNGNYAFAATGNLDAPDFMPQGSVRVSGTMRHAPHLSLAHRDGAGRPIGAQHDGPESAQLSLPFEDRE